MNVLIVDDLPRNRKLLRAQLEAEGLVVSEANDGVDALVLLNGGKIDAVISDILMPGMDGYRFCYEVRQNEQFRDLPIIIYTATYTSPSDEKLSLDVGADKYLRKPASSKEILDALDEATAKKQHPASKVPLAKMDVLKEYSECLVAKLEEKNIKLTDRNEALAKINAKLEREITQRRSIQETLERLRHHHELILNSAAEGIYGLDLNGNIFFENPKAAELLGWTDAELLGKPAHATIHHKRPNGNNYPIEDCPVYASMRDGGTRRVTNDAFWRKDRTSFRVDYVCAPIRDDGERVSGAIVTFKDITDQVAAEARLKLQEQQYRLLFETNPSPMWVFNTRTLQILAANEAALAQYGYSRDEFLKLKLKDLGPSGDVPDRIRTRALSSPHPMSHYSGQFQHSRKDGSLIIVEIYSSPVPLVWESVAARIVTAIDVTERKRVEKEFRSTHE